jgi:hypothetical protein
MRLFWGRKATIKGLVHYHPSGRIRFIEAQILKPFEEGEEIFGKQPCRQGVFEIVEEMSSRNRSSDTLKDIWGRWPGDETIEELLCALKGEPS